MTSNQSLPSNHLDDDDRHDGEDDNDDGEEDNDNNDDDDNDDDLDPLACPPVAFPRFAS